MPVAHLSLAVLSHPTLQVLAGWHVRPGAPWVSDLLAAVQRQLPRFSRSRLVELLLGLVPLGVQLLVGVDGGTGDAAATVASAGEAGTPAIVEAGTAVVPGAAPWLCAYLRCFLSRKFRQPLPRHLVDLAEAVSALCHPVAVAGWDGEAAGLLLQVLGSSIEETDGGGAQLDGLRG